MKIKLSVLLFALTLVWLCSACTPQPAPSLAPTPTPEEVPPTAAATVRLTPEQIEVSPGQIAQLDVAIDQVEGLYGADLILEFDPAAVEIVDTDPQQAGVQITPGEFLSADLVAQNQADLDQGTVLYAVSQMAPREAASGSGTLATIMFTGRTPGDTVVTFKQVLLATSNGEQITPTIPAVSVIIHVKEE